MCLSIPPELYFKGFSDQECFPDCKLSHFYRLDLEYLLKIHTIIQILVLSFCALRNLYKVGHSGGPQAN